MPKTLRQLNGQLVNEPEISENLSSQMSEGIKKTPRLDTIGSFFVEEEEDAQIEMDF